MGPNQGPKVLLEGSNHNLDSQMISKLDKLIVESSGSTRRIQRAQEHRILTSLSQKIIHRTVYDQGIQHRPSIQTTSHLPLILHIFTTLLSLEKGPLSPRNQERDRRSLLPHCSSSTTVGVLSNHRQTPEFCRTTVGPSPDAVVLLNHRRASADHHLRPDVLSDHHLRPDVLPDHHLRPDVLPDHHLRPDVLPDHQLRPDVMSDHHLRPEVSSNHRLTPEFHRTTN
ncbi:hypothetical protein M5K25_012337 [Dendrobium thyrsiflorum]|uniref:Uncharacterized protein n=1 Tax=Dendrobium thyrsiflorum TaxID=117978 RepID=A0ABD0V3T7_DENTH